jgi:putative flavoprotein involved in K+ transport
MDNLGTIIVGAGQTGLATAYELTRAGVACTVFDAHSRVGDQWRQRYDSLRLNTPAKWDSLPGMAFPAPANTWPTGREMGDYLEKYVADNGLDVRCGMPVRRVERRGDGTYEVTTSGGTFTARNVVVATGCERVPRVPGFAEQLDPGIRQLHSSAYRNPGQLLPGPVLVVGASQSGADLAVEIARAGRETTLCGRVHGEVPVDIEGPKARLVAPLLWFIANHVLTMRTPMGRRARPQIRTGGTPLVRVRRKDLDAAGVRRIEEHVEGVVDGQPRTESGEVLEVRNVVWCTGFRQDFSFIHPNVTGPDGWPMDEGGVVPSSPGLYFVGLVFQNGFYSMLIGGAGRDAAFIARHVLARERSRAREEVAA